MYSRPFVGQMKTLLSSLTVSESCHIMNHIKALLFRIEGVGRVESDRSRTAVAVSVRTMVVNIFLSAFKLFAGILRIQVQCFQTQCTLFLM